MSENCNCKKCSEKTICCETKTVCYEQKCVNPCLLLNEPCNPCPPQVKTVCFPSPYDPCNPCPPYPPYPPCPPYPCPPKNNELCPQYVVNNVVINTDVTLTSQQVNSYNYFVFGTSGITVTLPAISTLNNQGRKNINLVNLSNGSITVVPGGSDSLNGLGSVNIDANKTLILSSLPLVSTGATWSVNGD